MASKYPNLFSPLRIGNVTVKNRVVSGPMNTAYTSIDGTLTQRQAAYYMERVRGGVGMMIIEAAALDWPYGKGGRRQPRFNDPCVTPDWADFMQPAHSYGCKVLCQLNHLGFRTTRYVNGGQENVTASAASEYSEEYPARELTVWEIKELVHKFGCSAGIACEADFDGVEIHAAHEYLINQFLSPLTNHRTDEYGGSLENRARFLVEIIKEVRRVIGPMKILSVRVPVSDWKEGGIDPAMGAQIAKICEDAGADMISCTTGFSVTKDQCFEAEFSPEGGRIFFGSEVKKLCKKAKVAVVGKIRDPQMAEDALANGDADLIIGSRTHLADPYWTLKAQMGREDEIRKCMSCLECFKLFRPGAHNMRCAINPFVGYELTATEHNVPQTSNPKKLLIAGGGVAGMQAAILAKKRGHSVKLVEKSERLGGHMRLAGTPPYKDSLQRAMNWFIAEVGRLGIDVEYGVDVGLDYIRSYRPDVAILSFGAEPARPPVKGIERCIDAWDVLADPDKAPGGKEIVVLGGGTVGCETAEFLAFRGNHMSVIELTGELCRDQEQEHKDHVLMELTERGTALLTSCAAQEIGEDFVSYKDAAGEIHTIKCDMAVCATGQRPLHPDWVNELRSEGIDAYTLGDATMTGDIRRATRSAFDVVMAL